MAESGHMNAMAESSMEISMCWPPLPRSRANSAAVTAWATVYEVTLSHTSVRNTCGRPVTLSVCTEASPEAAWITLS